MPVIELITRIRCPIEIAFDLSRSIDLHEVSTAHTKEKAVEGRTEGLIELGETVTWEATHFGIRQRLTSKITEYSRPSHFRDSMVRGAFKRFDHDHDFEADGEFTVMVDRFDYTAPLGILGRIADVVFLKGYMTRLLERRNELIRSVAESDATQFLDVGS